MKNGLTKEHSKMLYGLAIVLMVVHHLFSMPSRMHCEINSLVGINVLEKIGWFCKICVAIYAFISGYAIYQKCHIKEGEAISFFNRLGNYCSNVTKQIWSFIKRYWIVFAIFITVGFATGKLSFEWKTFGKSLLGFDNSYNSEWWYVKFYIVMVAISPIICICCDCLKKWVGKKYETFTLIIIGVLALALSIGLNRFLKLNQSYCLIFFIGYMVAAFNIFEPFSILEKKKILHIILCCVVLAGLIVLRVLLTKSPAQSNLDILLITPFIYCVSYLFERVKPIFISLKWLGKYSIYIWLTHTFYCFYYFQKMVTFSGIAIVFFIFTFALSLATAIILNYIEIAINMLIKIVRDKLCKNKKVKKKEIIE